MKVYLACNSLRHIEDLVTGADVLIAFPYMTQSAVPLIRNMRNFILDSGVFTMINSGKRFNIEDYVDKYADFVRENKIKQYVEVDVDQIYGVAKTRTLRDRLEQRVGWQSIPVWHTIRGKESYLDDCKNYSYIALGFFITEGLPIGLTKRYSKSFIAIAHSYNCRIHGLGFTSTTELKNLPFDSVDSSTFSISQRFGKTFKFCANSAQMRQTPKPKNLRIK